MALDYRPLRAVTAREMGAALVRDGFKLARQKGSHQRVHPDGRRVTYHRSGDTFEIKTLRSMIERQARWTEDDLLRLELMT